MTTAKGTELDSSNEEAMPVEVVTEPGPAYFITNKGEVVYIADGPDSFDRITEDARKCQNEFYYVLGLNEPKGQDPAQMTLFQVNDNLVSLSMVPVSGTGSLGLAPIKNTAYYKLAKLPWELIQKVEQFFRKVDQDLGGSEAIIVLAFDERHDLHDPAGWRVIVPRQNNSASHCNYDPISVAEFIDDDDIDYIRQVGTIHSHPGMSAFASHTDEKDQATFDGVHITIGWRGNLSEFHAEIQAGGQNFTAPPTLVIDVPEQEKKDYPEFDNWAARVKKEVPGGPKATYGATKTTTAPYKAPTYGTNSWGNSRTEGIKPPVGCPSLTAYTVVTNFLTGKDSKCPVCKEELTAEMKEMRRCRNCQVFVLYNGEEIADAVRVRKELNRPVYELIPEEAKLNIAFWRRKSETDYQVEFIPVDGAPLGNDSPKGPGTQIEKKQTGPWL